MTREEITHGDVTYIVETYDSGAVVKYIKGEFYTPEPPAPETVEPTELDKINEKLDTHSQLLLQLGMASIAPPAPEEIPQAPTVPGHPDPTSLPPVPDDMTLDPDLLLGLMDTPPTPPDLP